VPLQPLRRAPWRVVDYYAAGGDAAEADATGGEEGATEEEDAKQFVALNWLLADGETDPAPGGGLTAGQVPNDEGLALVVLSHLLCGSASSPLHRALMDSGLGEAVVGGSFDFTMRQPNFSVGLQGVSVGDSAAEAEAATRRVEAVVLDTLQALVAEAEAAAAAGGGAEAAWCCATEVAAKLNSVEFMQREASSDGQGGRPKGLMLLLSMVPQWIYSTPRAAAGAADDAADADARMDLAASCRFEPAFDKLKARLAAGENVFADVLKRRLLDNGHRVTVSLRPDTGAAAEAAADAEAAAAAALLPAHGFGGGAFTDGTAAEQLAKDGWIEARARAAEEGRLAAEGDALRAAAGGDAATAAARLADASAALRKRQITPDSPEALALLPSLAVADMEPAVKTVPTTVSRVPVPLLLGGGGGGDAVAERQSGATVLRHELPTSGILYATVAIDVQRALALASAGADIAAHDAGAAAALGHTLPELVPLLPLLCRALTEWGTARRDEAAWATRVGTHTGGIGAVSWFGAPAGAASPRAPSGVVGDPRDAECWLMLKGKAMGASHADELLGLMAETLRGATLDRRERFVEACTERRAGFEGAMSSAGHAAAAGHIAARYDAPSWLSNRAGGYVSSITTLTELIEAASTEEGWRQRVLPQLELLRTALLSAAAIQGGGAGSALQDGVVVGLTGDADALAAAEAPLGRLLGALGGGANAWEGGEPTAAAVEELAPLEQPAAVARAHWGELGGPLAGARAQAWTQELELQEEGEEGGGGGYSVGLSVPSQVYYVVQGGRAYSAGEAVNGGATVAARALSNDFLWEQVRLRTAAARRNVARLASRAPLTPPFWPAPACARFPGSRGRWRVRRNVQLGSWQRAAVPVQLPGPGGGTDAQGLRKVRRRAPGHGDALRQRPPRGQARAGGLRRGGGGRPRRARVGGAARRDELDEVPVRH
jgi:hypothetical protein